MRKNNYIYKKTILFIRYRKLSNIIMSDLEDERNKSNEKSCPPSPVSTRSDDLISRVDIAEISDFDDYQSLSTSAVLSRCKHKILKPYLRLLAVMGLRSFGTDRPNVSDAVVALSYVHLLHVILFTVLGYVLQFIACFRRDRGFCCRLNEDVCKENVTFGYVIPSVLHFSAYVYVMYLIRFKETEKLENLMERTFLLSAHRTDGTKKAHLVRSLWIFILLSILWLVMSLSSVIVLLLKSGDIFQWLSSNRYKVIFEAILVLATLWQDMVQIIVITSYCLQVQLLSSSLYFLRAKLLQHTIQPLSWIREINECQNFLNYLNDDFSPGVCIFIFLNASWVISGVIWVIRNENTEDNITRITIIVAICLWLVAALIPFIMSAWLTSSCTMLKHLGHEVRIRPFVYQDTPGEDLDTILLYTSTLRLKSKLFGVPISGRYLFCCVTLIAVSILVLEQSQLL